MHAGLRSALFGSALPLAGYELAMDFRAGWYRSGAVVTRDPAALPGYSFGRDRAKWDNINGVLVPAASGQPAIIPGLGFLAREQTTNYAPNSSWTGMAVGSNASPSMSMNIGTRNGVTLAVVDKGVENGLDYIDLQITGTANNTASPGAVTYFYPIVSGTGSATNPRAAQGDIWTNSISARLIAGSLNGFVAGTSGVGFSNQFRDDSGTSQLAAAGMALLSTVDPTVVKRSVVTLGPSPAATTNIYCHLTIGILDGQTVNLRIRLFGLSMNKTPVEMPHIATSSGSAASSADNMRLTQPLPADEDWVILSSVAMLRTSAQQGGSGNKRFWRLWHGTTERFGVYRNSPIANGAAGRLNGIVTGADGTPIRPPGGDIPVSGRIGTALRKVGSGYQLMTRGPDGSTTIGSSQTITQYPAPLGDFSISAEVDGYHEFFGWRRGSFSDAQVVGMLAALA